MSDLAKNLLTQYYGFNSEATGRKVLSIQRSIENVKSEEVKHVTEQISVTTNEKDIISEDECQNNIDTNRALSSESEKYRRSSRAFNEIEDAYDSDESPIIYEIDSKQNVRRNIHENTESGADRAELSKTNPIFVTKEDGLKDAFESDSSLMFAEDTFPNNASNVSTIALAKSPKSLKISSPLPSVIKKEAVCNETFADFSNTGLKKFPKEILNEFSQLRMLYLGDNNLIELPDEIFTILKHLKWLDIRNNQISILPNSIESHHCIETLLLQKNSIMELPVELCTLPKLKTLQVAQNPLVTPPKDIAALGITSILEFLRTKWNKIHPDHQIEFKEHKIEPKLSTILCYQSPRKSKREVVSSKIQGYNKNSSIKKKCKTYKPSNRCESKGANALEERRILWYSKARDVLAKQALILQKLKDENALKTWRRDRRSFNIAIKKAMRRSGDDIPFGFDLQDYSSIFKQGPKSKTATLKEKDKQKFNPPKDINMTINKMLESLNHLSIETMDVETPKTKQSLLKKDIEKILQFQNEIKKLQKYNDVATASLKI